MKFHRNALWGLLFLGAGALGANAWYISTQTCPLGWLLTP